MWFVGDMEDRVLEQALVVQEGLEFGQELGEEGPVDRSCGGGLGRPEQGLVLSLACVDANGVPHAPLGEGVCPLEAVDAAGLGQGEPAAHISPVKAVRPVGLWTDAQQLGGALDSIQRRRENRHGDHVQAMLRDVAQDDLEAELLVARRLQGQCPVGTRFAGRVPALAGGVQPGLHGHGLDPRRDSRASNRNLPWIIHEPTGSGRLARRNPFEFKL